jgi:hypothetical protein
MRDVAISGELPIAGFTTPPPTPGGIEDVIGGVKCALVSLPGATYEIGVLRSSPAQNEFLSRRSSELRGWHHGRGHHSPARRRLLLDHGSEVAMRGMLRGVLLAVFALAVGLMIASPASAERRIALVVGNAHYDHTGLLANPRNDAQDVAEKLKGLGFEVMLSVDLDQASFAHAIDDFARRLDGADVGLFYYAGHALQMNEKNYLVSTNAKLESAFLVPAETIELEPVVRLMESKVPVNLIFLDACRNNPLADNLKRSLAAMQRSVTLGRGLGRIEPAARDTLIAFAAAPGQEASDGAGRNSPFTAALLKHIAQPGLEVSVMLKEVAAEVREKTENAQRPQQLSDMSRTFYFAKAEALPTPGPAIQSSAQAQKDDSVELAFWRSASAANDCEAVRAYLGRFPSGSFTELARISEKRLCAASGVTVASNAPASGPASSTLSAPAAAPAPVVPSAPTGTSPDTSQSPTMLSRLAPVTEARTNSALPTDAVRDLQSQLLRVGCGSDEQEADGTWGPAWQAAVRRFNSSAHANLDPEHPSADAVASVQGHGGPVCPLTCGPGREPRDGSCVAKSKPSPEAAPRKNAARSQERNHREVTRHPAASGERRAARSDNPPPLVPTVPGNPYRESYTYVGNKRCKTWEPPGAAPRIICP